MIRKDFHSNDLTYFVPKPTVCIDMQFDVHMFRKQRQLTLKEMSKEISPQSSCHYTVSRPESGLVLMKDLRFAAVFFVLVIMCMGRHATACHE